MGEQNKPEKAKTSQKHDFDCYKLSTIFTLDIPCDIRVLQTEGKRSRATERRLCVYDGARLTKRHQQRLVLRYLLAERGVWVVPRELCRGSTRVRLLGVTQVSS